MEKLKELVGRVLVQLAAIVGTIIIFTLIALPAGKSLFKRKLTSLAYKIISYTDGEDYFPEDHTKEKDKSDED